MAMEVTQILLNAQAVDASLRKQAEDNLKQFQEQNLPSFLFSLAGELANDEKPSESRRLAGLILKNALDSKEQHKKIEFVQRWLAMDPTFKAQVKAFLLRTLSSPSPDARSTASQVIAKVAGIELPHKQWPELIGSLLSNAHQLPAPTRQATLETLGYICEEVSPDVVEQDHVNKILTAVVQGMNSTEENNDVRLAAIQALYNALGFAQANFSNDMERDYIMRIVCEATLSPEIKIRRAAFECLVAISSTYYEKLAPYIQDIFTITAKAVKEDEEPVALQAIEFWSSICDEEIDILEEYGGEFSGDSDVPCSYFIKQALPFLIPMLLETLLKQEEDQDQDEGAWNIAMAGGTCLGLVARTVGDDIVPLVMPFIEENITKPDWRQREAATYAFGSILEGPSPEKLVPLVNMALSFMLNALTKDPNNHVKDTTAWTLGRMFEFLHGSALDTPIINKGNCQQIITVLLHSMKDVPNVAEKACGALYFLAQGYEDAGSASSPLTPFFQEIVQALLTVTHREDTGESRLRTAAYEALNEVVRCSNDDTAPMVAQLVTVIMMELHQTLENQKRNMNMNSGKSVFVMFAFVLFAWGNNAQDDTLVPAIITFGDSAVDVGNNDYLYTLFKANYLPYGRDFASHKPTGRFCNGKLATDITAETLGFKSYAPAYLSPQAKGKNLLIGANFASAASGYDEKAAILNHAIPFSQQLKYYKEYQSKLAKIAGRKKAASIIKGALYLLSGGSSDFVQNYYVNPIINKVVTPDQYSAYLVGSFSSFVKDLYKLGARKIGVTSLPPLGCLPATRTLFGFQEKGCVTRINNDAQGFNKKMNSAAAKLQKQLPGLKIVVFNIFKPLYELVQSPSKFGFAEARRGCCGVGTVETTSLLCNQRSLGTCSNATQYVFWDSVHPSEAANQVLADALIEQGISLIG